MFNTYTVAGNNFFPGDTADQSPFLSEGIYTIKASMQRGLYFQKSMEYFEFPFEVYDFEKSTVDHIAKTYESTSGNLGILFSGPRGTSKSVTSKMICNSLRLPVILVTEALEGLDSVISSIGQDVIILIDEYDKVFGTRTDLLAVMDGASSGLYRRVFMLTTNSVFGVNENMLQRPGRIRYHLEFNGLNTEQVNEIVSKSLKDKNRHTELVEFIMSLHNVTIDIVTRVIEEVNIHEGVTTKTLARIMNIRVGDILYKVERTRGLDAKPYGPPAKVRPQIPFSDEDEGKSLVINGAYMGAIHGVIDDTSVVILESVVEDLLDPDEWQEVIYSFSPVRRELNRSSDNEPVFF